MTGGLMNLVAYGSENLLFNGNPKKTFFNATYQKYTNFGLQRFRIDFNGTKILNDKTNPFSFLWQTQSSIIKKLVLITS